MYDSGPLANLAAICIMRASEMMLDKSGRLACQVSSYCEHRLLFVSYCFLGERSPAAQSLQRRGVLSLSLSLSVSLRQDRGGFGPVAQTRPEEEEVAAEISRRRTSFDSPRTLSRRANFDSPRTFRRCAHFPCTPSALLGILCLRC